MPSRPTLALLAVAAVVAVGGLLAVPPPAASRSSGANPGFAGDVTRNDGTPQTCAVCHSSFEPNAGPGTVTVDAPATAAPGDRVPITVALTDAALQAGGRQGFEATVRDPETGDLWGTLHLTDATETQFASTTEGTDEGYVTHTTAGTARSTWTFDWEPDAGRVGTARVYVAANAADGNGTTSGDYAYSTTLDVAVAPVADAPRPNAAFEVGAPHPHPVRAGEAVRLDVVLDRPGGVAVRLADGLGRTVRQLADGARAAGPQTVRVETDGLAPGTYFVVVDGPGGRRSRPFIVVR